MLQKIKKFKGIILPSLLIVLVAVVGFCFLGNDSKTNLKTKEQLRLLEYNQVKADEEKIEGTDYVTFDAFFLEDLNSDGIADPIRGMSKEIGENGKLRFNNCLSYLKAGLVYADRITTVSRTYKNDLCSFEGGYGLQSIFSYRYKDFYGIVNGIDYEQNNPKTDPDIFYQYDRRNINNKKKNKVEFQKKYGLPVDENIPLIAMVSRLTWQKGLDIFFGSIERILEKNVQLLVVGSGDYEYEQRLSYLQTKYPNKMYVFIGYQASLAKLAYAASDYFLMPSLFEPCGISQLIALRYGSLPIVREVGGLVDTVTAFNEYTKEGTGFSFKNYSSDELYNTVNYALSFYNTDDYKLLVKNAMGQDFSWEKSTVEYIELYKSLLK